MQMISTERLRRFPIFSGLDEGTLRELAMAGREDSFARGEILFEEGQPAEELWLLTAGEADLRVVLPGGERRTVDTAVAGDLLVWSAVVPPHRMHLEGVARTDARALRFRADRVRELMERDPSFGYRLMRAVAGALCHRLEGTQTLLAVRVP
ncbi:MAG: cyclic nucleotide-binding domain-containing protein [Acidobacteria bacterium]|nr:MAG: cyclic nucleotide-binding domain-containing protein [Acidobacteriota bacterium]